MALRLDWCSQQAARYAVEHWHYSKTLPMPPCLYVGVWESGVFVGVVVFSPGASPNLSRSFSLTRYECAELTRIALSPSHQAPTSQIAAIAVRMVRKHCPGLCLLVSYADPVQGHAGTIYQAMGWLYLGVTTPKTEYRLHGARLEPRAYTGVNFGAPKQSLPKGALAHRVPPKHKYALPLAAAVRGQIQAMVQPYPERVSSVVSDTPAHQAGEGGATPTETL